MIVSTTLTGNAEASIGDALRSISPIVDKCLVIDTGITDRTLDIAREVTGDKFVLREFVWVNDFAAARNFALDAATELGAKWAFTVDTDERMIFSGDVRARLERSRANVVLVASDDGSYEKERIIRLPANVRWRGPTHEVLDGQRVGETESIAEAVFRELPKDAAVARRKFERDVAILTEYTRAHPDEPRWHYYLGTSLQELRRYGDAIVAFRACASLRGWPEEGAWACYRAAECLCALERFGDAIEQCALGLSLRPATAELAWLAGFAAYKCRRFEDAVAWSRMAIANGLHEGAGKQFKRIGFRYLPALYEGPYDVLRWALGALGDVEGAKTAELEWGRAKRARS